MSEPLIFVPAIVLGLFALSYATVRRFTKRINLGDATDAREHWLVVSLTLMSSLCVCGGFRSGYAVAELHSKIDGWDAQVVGEVAIIPILVLIFFFLYKTGPGPKDGDPPLPEKNPIGKGSRLGEGMGILMFLSLTPAAYGLILCAKGFAKLTLSCNPCNLTEQQKFLGAFLSYRANAENFLVFLGVALAVGTMMVWTLASIENAKLSSAKVTADASTNNLVVGLNSHLANISSPHRVEVVPVVVAVQADYVLMFGLLFSALLVVLATPAFLAMNESAVSLKNQFVPLLEAQKDLKTWIDLNKAYLETTTLSPTAFLTSGGLSIVAPFATAVVTYVLPKAKDK